MTIRAGMSSRLVYALQRQHMHPDHAPHARSGRLALEDRNQEAARLGEEARQKREADERDRTNRHEGKQKGCSARSQLHPQPGLRLRVGQRVGQRVEHEARKQTLRPFFIVRNYSLRRTARISGRVLNTASPSLGDETPDAFEALQTFTLT